MPDYKYSEGMAFSSTFTGGPFFTVTVETNQIKNSDWKSRKIQIVGKVDDEVVEDCLEK